MEAIIPIALLGAFGKKALDVLKYLSAKDWNAAATQVAAWAVGTATVFVASGANLFENTVLPGLDQTFADLNSWSKVLLGSSILSLLGVLGVDFVKAVDNTQSAAFPKLFKKLG